MNPVIMFGMAIGFPASYTASITTYGTPDATRTAIIGAFQSLGWTYEILGPDRCEASVPVNILSWGEVMTVELTSMNSVTITSKCRGIQIIDWGKNKQNVDQFLSHFAGYASQAPLGQNPKSHFDERGRSPVENLIRDNR